MTVAVTAATLSLLLGNPAAVAAAPLSLFLAETGRQPRIAVSPDGTSAAVAYGIKDEGQTTTGTVYCTVSADGGKTWGPRVLVGTVPGLALGMRRGPQIAVAPGRIAVLAIGHPDGNVLAWTSVDSGSTWSGPAQVNDVKKSAEEGLHGVAAAPDGTLLAAWLDHRDGGGQQLRGARLEAGATAWTENQLIYASPDGHVCECCHPFVTSDSVGDFYVLFRNWLDGARDQYLSISTDAGRTFNPARKIGTGTWNIDGCPMAGGWVAAASPRQIVTAFSRKERIYRGSPHMQEASMGPGKQPAIALGLGGEFLIWNREGVVRLYSPYRDTSESLGAGSYPAIAAPPDGRGPVIAVWETPTGGIAGMTWSRRSRAPLKEFGR